VQRYGILRRKENVIEKKSHYCRVAVLPEKLKQGGVMSGKDNTSF
jgi:hypothetical protein